MKVLLPEGIELQGFERRLQTVLEQADLDGYALMGFRFEEVNGQQFHEIDALVVMESGVFACLEAKGWRGSWTGNANERWFCDGQEIRAVGVNPYMQVRSYCFVIKDKLHQLIFGNMQFRVDDFVVAPDNTSFEIQGAVINQFRGGNSIKVCHLSRVEQILRRIPTTNRVQARVREIGLLQILSQLTGVPIERLLELDTRNLSRVEPPILRTSNFEEQDPEPKETDTPSSQHNLSVIDNNPKQEKVHLGTPDHNHRSRSPLIVVLSALGVIVLGGVLIGLGQVAFNRLSFGYSKDSQSCAASNEVREQDSCYKDVSKTPLVIGTLTSPNRYSRLETYLERQLTPQVSSLIIEGNSEVAYQEALNHLAQKNWDIVFALSPMIGMRAKDNGYKWIARMFPNYPSTYQSALFVKSDSSIQSINDITPSTRISLGDFNSASSFYVPAFDLYGKTLTVTVGDRSQKIIELVASGKADVGAAVYSVVKDDPRFRVIHVSRELPGSGVYLSPKLSPSIQKQIEEVMMNAPKEIKGAANYDAGDEPTYDTLRSISLRADEVLSCADFTRNPVQFFCGQAAQGASQATQGVVGRIGGFTNKGNGEIRLRLEQEDGKTCHILTSLQVLSRVPDGTSPGILNRKRVNVTKVVPKQLDDGTCEISVSSSDQLTVLR